MHSAAFESRALRWVQSVKLSPESTPASNRDMQPEKLSVISCSFVCLAGLTLMSALESTNQFFALISQFKMLIFGCTILLSLKYAHQKSWRGLIACLFLISIINPLPIFGLFVPNEKGSEKDSDETLRICEINLCGKENHNYASVISYLREKQPDVLVLVEVTPDWIKQLTINFPNYRYEKSVFKYGGISILSTCPLLSEASTSNDIERPRLKTFIQSRNDKVCLLAMHAATPHLARFELLKSDFAQAAAESAAESQIILIGDLNCAPWTQRFQTLLGEGKLPDTECGFGFEPTWPAWLPLFPIDHVLVSKKLRVVTREVGPDIGSDHRPLFVKLSVSH